MKRLVLALAIVATGLATAAAAPADRAVRHFEPRDFELHDFEPRDFELRDFELRDFELRHFELRRSAPAADTVLSSSPTEIRLWFSQEPQDGSTSIRLVGADGAAVHSGDVVQDPAEPTAFSIALHGSLAPGTYTVAWRALGQDGHVVRDDFAFTLAGG